MHSRQVIREKIKALLLNETAAGDKVFTNRSRPVDDKDLPVIVIRSGPDRTEVRTESPRTYNHSFLVHIDLEVKQTQAKSAEDQLDDLAKEIEDILLTNETLDGLVEDVREPDTGEPEISNGEASHIFGDMRVSFDIIYQSEHVEAVADDFEKAHVTYDVDNEEQENQPKDEITLPIE